MGHGTRQHMCHFSSMHQAAATASTPSYPPTQQQPQQQQQQQVQVAAPPLGWRSLAMSPASFCRLASAVRCCMLAVAEGTLGCVSILMATVVSQYCWGERTQGGGGWVGAAWQAAGTPASVKLLATALLLQCSH